MKAFQPPTPRQNAARMRNWGIRQLRALQAQSHMLGEPRRAVVMQAIDDELLARGAKTHAQHVEAVSLKWSKQEQSK